MKLPANYRVKPEDVSSAWDIIFLADASHEERQVAKVIDHANDMHEATGTWPTISEAEKDFWKCSDAWWQENFKRNAPRTEEERKAISADQLAQCLKLIEENKKK